MSIRRLEGMKKGFCIIFLMYAALAAGCSGGGMIGVSWHTVVFPTTRITEVTTKTIQLANDSDTTMHVIGINFYGDSNSGGNFVISSVKVNAAPASTGSITIPPKGVLEIAISYAPSNLTSSAGANEATLSGSEVSALQAYGVALGGEAKRAIHEALIVVAYDKPAGYANIKVVGVAVPGPNGEVSAPPLGGGGECMPSGNTACFTGTFSIHLPGLMSGPPLEVPMHGAIPIKIEGSAAEIDMNEFPPILIPLKGNGPGEPLEGKPVEAITIIVSGEPDTSAKGSFDGSTLKLSGTNLRVRVDLGELTYDDITPNLATAVDFCVRDLVLDTLVPFDGTNITFGTETTLSQSPSGNNLFDSFLANAKVVVKFTGRLLLP